MFLTLILHIQWMIQQLKIQKSPSEASSGSKLYADPNDDTQYEWDVKEEHGSLRWLKRATKTNLYFNFERFTQSPLATSYQGRR